MTNKIERGDYPALEALLRKMLGLDESPIGFNYTDDKPENAITAKKKGRVCIYPFLNRVRKGDYIVFRPLSDFTIDNPPDTVIIYGDSNGDGRKLSLHKPLEKDSGTSG